MKNVFSPEFLAEYERHQTAPVDATPTGLPTLDRICRDAGGGKGIGRSWFVTVAGNPGFGKSALALNFASAALNHGESIGLISLEMSAQQVSTRLYALHTGTHLKTLEHGGFNSQSWLETKQKLSGSPPLYVPDTVLGDWRATIEYAEQCYTAGCRYIILDYLQLCNTGDEDTIYKATQRVVSELRAFGVRKGCTIICLSQFNRTTSSNYDSPPRSQGLFGGQTIEASSDLCLLLDHSRAKREGNHTGLTWLLIGKNRHGPTITDGIPIMFDYRTLKISEGNESEEDRLSLIHI